MVVSVTRTIFCVRVLFLASKLLDAFISLGIDNNYVLFLKSLSVPQSSKNHQVCQFHTQTFRTKLEHITV